jgi:hypothetical protein
VRLAAVSATASAGVVGVFGTRLPHNFLLQQTLHLWYILPRMEWKWEMHTPEPGLNNRERIRVTINKLGTIYLNASAFKSLGHPEAVLLMFDRRRHTIGISGAPANHKQAILMKLKSGDGSGGRCIYARTFCKDFDIHPTETFVFPEATINRDGILLLNLNAVKPSTKKRR